jgi:hypothetical protein
MKSSSRTDWDKLASMPDEDIDTSDIPPIQESFFQEAELRLPAHLIESIVLDGINTFVSDVLLAQGMVDPGRCEEVGIVKQMQDVANKVAEKWKHKELHNV